MAYGGYKNSYKEICHDSWMPQGNLVSQAMVFLLIRPQIYKIYANSSIIACDYVNANSKEGMWSITWKKRVETLELILLKNYSGFELVSILFKFHSRHSMLPMPNKCKVFYIHSNIFIHIFPIFLIHFKENWHNRNVTDCQPPQYANYINHIMQAKKLQNEQTTLLMSKIKQTSFASKWDWGIAIED